MRVMGIPPGLGDAVGDVFGRRLVCGPLGFGHLVLEFGRNHRMRR